MLVTIISGVLAADTLCCVWIAWAGGRFLRRVPVIETEAHLAEFRRVVAQMQWAAFGFLVCLLLASLGSLVGCWFGVIRRADLEPIAITGMLRLVVASYAAIGVENRLKEVQAATPELRREVAKLLHAWLNDPFPGRRTESEEESL